MTLDRVFWGMVTQIMLEIFLVYLLFLPVLCFKECIYIYCIYHMYPVAIDGEKLGLKIDSLKQQLQDADCMVVLTACKEPKSFNEIKATKIKEGKLFKVLKDLKISEALLFADGKYYTSPEALVYIS